MIESITFKAKNAFGIGAMSHEFTFKDSRAGRCMAIYAPNGTCKSSMRKALEKWNEGLQPSDVFFPDRESSFSIDTAPDRNAIPQGNVFCFKSMPELEGMRFFDDELIASPDLKARYVDFKIWHRKEVEDLLAAIHDELISGRSYPTVGDMHGYIKEMTGIDDLYSALSSLLEKAKSLDVPEFMREQKQDELLKKGYEDKLNKAVTKDIATTYASVRRSVMDSSTVFHNGFDPNAAKSLVSALEKAHFFDAGHSIVLHDQTTDNDLPPIGNKKDLEAFFDKEFRKVAADPEVQKAYANMDKGIGGSKEADGIRDLLCSNPEFAERASDLRSLKHDYLAQAVGRCRIAVEHLLAGKDEYITKMRELADKANAEHTDWDRAIKLFEQRFHVPFSLKIGNRANAFVEGTEPVIEFSFEGVPTDHKTLFDNLSDGERKALYMLAAVFQVEAAKRASGPRVLVFDDVVDSFDYANKYAFIEYLREFADAPDLYILLLTHNYDFFRTVTSRLDGFSRKNCVIADRGPESRLEFETVQFLDASPFQFWKSRMHEDAYKVAAIPMVRELVAIRGGKNSEGYGTLSSALHGREGSSISFGDLHQIFQTYWDCGALENDGERVCDVTRQVCKELYDRDGSLKLQEKVAMALGIRLIVEGCLGRLYASRNRELPDSEKMGKLVKDYREHFSDDYRLHGGIAEDAAVITPENIHVNSFMYEPLVDIGSQRFFDLYKRCMDWEGELA